MYVLYTMWAAYNENLIEFLYVILAIRFWCHSSWLKNQQNKKKKNKKDESNTQQRILWQIILISFWILLWRFVCAIHESNLIRGFDYKNNE